MSLYADKGYYQNTFKGSSLSSDNELNNRCDELAREETEKIQNP